MLTTLSDHQWPKQPVCKFWVVLTVFGLGKDRAFKLVSGLSASLQMPNTPKNTWSR